MRILLTGTTGQLGWELQRSLAILGELMTPGRDAFDLSTPETLRTWLDTHKPDLVVNPAAYTAVDKAEDDKDQAFAVNAHSPAVIAHWCASHDAALIHYSTDYVFNGEGHEPFREDGPTNPVNVYGESKLLGEQEIRGSNCHHVILRTSWVYAARGANFVNTMLRLAETHRELRVVDDQIGAPTPARLLADATALVLARQQPEERILQGQRETFHFAPSGNTSWFEFAETIMRIRAAHGGGEAPVVRPIPTSEYPTPAIRPLNSRLDCSRFSQRYGITLPHWRNCLANVLADRLGLGSKP